MTSRINRATIPWENLEDLKCTSHSCSAGSHKCRCGSESYELCTCKQCVGCKSYGPTDIRGRCGDCRDRFDEAVYGLVSAWGQGSQSRYAECLAKLGELMWVLQ